MNATRYFLGVLLVLGVPPAILFWLLIHPFARFWRRIGPKPTYLVAVALLCVVVLALYQIRAGLLGPDLGTNWSLFVPGCFLYMVSAWISIVTRRQLDDRTFAGLPEISQAEPKGALLQGGIYGVVRHPRYLAVIIGISGFSLVVNYLGPYLVVLGSIPALLLVVMLEERELADRFGAEYQEYRARVPAFFPRIRSGSR